MDARRNAEEDEFILLSVLFAHPPSISQIFQWGPIALTDTRPTPDTPRCSSHAPLEHTCCTCPVSVNCRLLHNAVKEYKGNFKEFLNRLACWHAIIAVRDWAIAVQLADDKSNARPIPPRAKPTPTLPLPRRLLPLSPHCSSAARGVGPIGALPQGTRLTNPRGWLFSPPC